MQFLGLDIGGANLKAADGGGFATSLPFPLWQKPHELAPALGELIAAAPRCDGLAVTMTGELADCFETKQAGVNCILDAVEEAAGPRRLRVYLTSGDFVASAEARERWLEAAASNWHALASLAAKYCEHGDGLLLDIGSTTTDIIPIRGGSVAAVGRTDPERLLSGELVYTGIERSPACAVAQSIPWRGADCPLAQELFATMRDVYLLLGDVSEDPHDRNTADGRPATRAAAHVRLARMICGDSTMFAPAEARAAAKAVARRQIAALCTAARRGLDQHPRSTRTAVISGGGEFLARRVLDSIGWGGPIVALSQQLGPGASRCAPAHAVATLANHAHDPAAPARNNQRTRSPTRSASEE